MIEFACDIARFCVSQIAGVIVKLTFGGAFAVRIKIPVVNQGKGPL